MRVVPFTVSIVLALLVVIGLFRFATPKQPVRVPVADPVSSEVSATPTGVHYIEVADSCGPYFDGPCLNARSGPGIEYPAIAKLRNGIVLEVASATERGGETWYEVVFNEWLRYPERVRSPWFVSGRYVRSFYDEVSDGQAFATSSKKIIVDRSEQRLTAYDGDTLFMDEPISTGLELTPTPRGVFHIYRKTPSRYMQGPIDGITAKTYDLPGVPWNLYFTAEGAVIHGTYWHDHFGQPWSNGCVNLPTDKARQLYEWAGLGTTVIVRD